MLLKPVYYIANSYRRRTYEMTMAVDKEMGRI